jgi:hypothetical protein
MWQHVGIIGTGYMQLNPSNKTHATIPDASNTKLWVFFMLALLCAWKQVVLPP